MTQVAAAKRQDACSRFEEMCAILGDPSAWSTGEMIEIIPTHLSIVYLVGDLAYKLKRPLIYGPVDYRSLQARKTACQEELLANRRFSPTVYLGLAVIEPCAATGRLVVKDARGSSEEPIDWLVKMRRLPAELMLDRSIAENRIDWDGVRLAGEKLARLYVTSPREGSPGIIGYRARLARDIEDHAKALREFLPERDRISRIARRLRERLRSFEPLMVRRAKEGFLVEGHGDLRPEHVCMTTEPTFIDCLEYDPARRRLDALDDLALIASESAAMGAPKVGEVFLEAYRDFSGDEVPRELWRFFLAWRSFGRARLAAWHIDQVARGRRQEWIDKTHRRLAVAEENL